jgi:hypothetical protein
MRRRGQTQGKSHPRLCGDWKCNLRESVQDYSPTNPVTRALTPVMDFAISTLFTPP